MKYPAMIYTTKDGKTRTCANRANLKGVVRAHKGNYAAVIVFADASVQFFGKNRKAHDCMARGE